MMAKSKEDNAKMLDPNRFKQAKSMAVLPGGPSNNDPQNVNSINPNIGTFDGITKHPYGDTGNLYSQMGTDAVFPAPASKLLAQEGQNAVVGRGYNEIAYNRQQQPSSNAEEPMEGMRLAMDANNRGLFTSQFMGPVGQQVPIPAATAMTGQQTDNTIGLQGFPSAEVPSKGMNTKTGKRGKA